MTKIFVSLTTQDARNGSAVSAVARRLRATVSFAMRAKRIFRKSNSEKKDFCEEEGS